MFVGIFCFLPLVIFLNVVESEDDGTDVMDYTRSLEIFMNSREQLNQKAGIPYDLFKPLNHDGIAMFDFTNGDKACYLALKHPYIINKGHRLVPKKKYRKVHSTDRNVLISREDFKTIRSEVSICYCADKNGDEDFFYITNTNKKNEYVILEMVELSEASGPKTELKVTVILNLKCEMKDLQEMAKYFKTRLTSTLWETTDPQLALKMFSIYGAFDKNIEHHVSKPLKCAGKKISGYLNGDKVCYLALNHPYINNLKRYKLPLFDVEDCQRFVIVKQNPAKVKLEAAYLIACNCSKNLHVSRLYIANTNQKHHYAILEKIKVLSSSLKTLKVLAILKLKCSLIDYSNMRKTFKH